MRELLFILTPSDGIPVTLDTSPDGFDESFIVTERSRKYHGIFRSFTIPLKFVKEGAAIIRSEFYHYGMGANCSILVQKLDKVTLTYFDAYTGRIDFNTFKDHDNSVDVMTVDTGLSQFVKINESTEYEMDPTLLGSTDAGYILIDNNAMSNNTIWALTPMLMFTKLVDNLTGGNVATGIYGAKSDFLTANTWLLLTTGQAWRSQSLGLPSDIRFKTTLTEFFTSLNSIFCLGMGVEIIGGVENLRIEERSYFYNKNIIHNVGSSKNLSIGLINEFNFSKIRVGYPEVDYGDVVLTDGEFNTYSNFTTGNTMSANEHDLESKYKGDWTGIQQVIYTWPITETDADVDYDTYFVDVIKHPTTPNQYSIATGNSIQNIAGIPTSGPAYNTRISPRRNLLRHLLFIKSCLFKLSGNSITFVSGGNNQISNQIKAYGESAYVVESLSVSIDDSNTWFVPLEINIDAPYPSNMVNLIAANPYGVIEFEYEKTTYQGYILKMETKLTGAGSIKYSLLSVNENDLAKLIR